MDFNKYLSWMKPKTPDRKEKAIIQNGADVETQTEQAMKRTTELVKHTSGKIWELKSRSEDGEFYPSSQNALFQKMENPTNTVASGGFEEDIQAMNKLGTFSELSSSVNALFDEYDAQIGSSDSLRKNIQLVAQDKFIFIALEQFLKDGGVLKRGRGKYDKNQLKIMFGTHKTQEENQSTFYHELLHYIFDREDSILSEVDSSGGADHFAISPLEERFKIISSIRSGKMPIGEEIDSLYGFTSDGSMGDKLKEALTNNDSEGLSSLIESDNFFTNYVQSGMVYPLSSNERNKNNRDFRMKLSNGKTLRILEDHKKEDEASAEERDFGGHDGVYIDIRIKNVKDLTADDLNNLVPEQDISNVASFLEEHQSNQNRNRNYILTDEQLHDIAYLNAYNASILQQSFRLAVAMSKKNETAIQDIFKQQEYQQAFSSFLRDLSEQQASNDESPVKKTALKTMNHIIKIAA